MFFLFLFFPGQVERVPSAARSPPEHRQEVEGCAEELGDGSNQSFHGEGSDPETSSFQGYTTEPKTIHDIQDSVLSIYSPLVLDQSEKTKTRIPKGPVTEESNPSQQDGSETSLRPENGSTVQDGSSITWERNLEFG